MLFPANLRREKPTSPSAEDHGVEKEGKYLTKMFKTTLKKIEPSFCNPLTSVNNNNNKKTQTVTQNYFYYNWEKKRKKTLQESAKKLTRRKVPEAKVVQKAIFFKKKETQK